MMGDVKSLEEKLGQALFTIVADADVLTARLVGLGWQAVGMNQPRWQNWKSNIRTAIRETGVNRRTEGARRDAYPMAAIVSKGAEIAYAFTSETFKDLGKLAFLRKGMPLPIGATREFNEDPANVLHGCRAADETDVATWFDVPGKIMLDEEIIGLGKYGYTLTILTSEALPEDPLNEEDEEAELEKSWTPRFAYRR